MQNCINNLKIDFENKYLISKINIVSDIRLHDIKIRID